MAHNNNFHNFCQTPAKANTGSWTWLIGIIVFCISLLSVIARAHFIQTRPFAGRVDGQEPESHILVTDLAFEQTSWKTHHFLPIFTLGAPYNKYINQHPGAASADRFGNYYYCSTPPLTFVLPYVAVKLVGASPSIAGLRWYNIVLQVLSALAMAGLVFLCTKKKGVEFELRLLASATAAVIYMTAPECLKSHSINLWAQQFYAFLLIIQIICFLFYPSTLLLFIFAFIGCLTDWTPYLANLAMTGIALFSYWKTRDSRALHLAMAIILGCLLAGLCMIGWFATVISIHDYFHNLIVRGSVRVGSLLRTVRLIVRYSNSFGLFSLIGLMVLFLRPWSRAKQLVVPHGGVILPGKDPFPVSFLIMGVALLENLLMGDHACAFSYDRLKGVQCLAFFIVGGTTWSRRASAWAFGLSVMVGLFSIWFFWRTYETPQGWNYVAHSEQERLGEIIVKTVSSNGPAFFNRDVRGAEVYYAHRNIFQLGDNPDVVAFVQAWCRQHHFTEGTLYEISGHYPFPEEQDLPRSLRVRRVYANGEIMDLGIFQMPEKPGDYHDPLGDATSDWFPDAPAWR